MKLIKVWANLMILCIITIISVMAYVWIRKEFDSDWAYTFGFISGSLYFSLKYK